MHVLRNSRRRVKGNRCPDGVDVLLGDIVLAQEGSRTVRAIHFEAVRLTAVLWSQSHVVEYCADVKQLGIKLQPAPFPRERSKKYTRVEWLNSSGDSVSRTSSVASRTSLLSGMVTPEIEIASVVFFVPMDICESPFKCGTGSVAKAV